VDLPDGSRSEAKFNVFRWPLVETPGGLRIFACQHLTRENVWVPELQRHANGATRIVRLEILAADAKAAAEHLSRLIDEPVTRIPEGFRVPSGGNRADFLFYDPASFAALYPQAVRAGAPREGAAAIVLATRDLEAARTYSRALPVGEGRACVPAEAANGVILTFVED
jgi:hypothetical protein